MCVSSQQENCALTHDEDDGALGHVDHAAGVRHADVDVDGHVSEAAAWATAASTGRVARAAGSWAARLGTRRRRRLPAATRNYTRTYTEDSQHGCDIC